MRVTEGDIVMINVINSKENNHTHSLHLHSTHPSNMDGMDGPGGYIKPGQNFTYHLQRNHMVFIRIIVMFLPLISISTMDFMVPL